MPTVSARTPGTALTTRQRTPDGRRNNPGDTDAVRADQRLHQLGLAANSA